MAFLDDPGNVQFTLANLRGQCGEIVRQFFPDNSVQISLHGISRLELGQSKTRRETTHYKVLF